MTELYKLLFDTSLYYTLTAYFGVMVFTDRPAPFGFLSLLAVIIADCVLRRWESRWACRARYMIILLPVAAVFTCSGWYQRLQLIPPWIYVAWSICCGRIREDYSGFLEHFKFSMKLLLLLLLGIPFWGRIADAFLSAIPYLVLMLADGICLLRMLREKQMSGVRQGLYMCCVICACAAVTLGQLPQLFVKGLGLFYQNILSKVLYALAVAIGAVFYFLYIALKWISSLAKGSPEPISMQLQSAAEILGLSDEYTELTSDFRWLRTVLIVLGVLMVILFLFFVFRRLAGRAEVANTSLLFRQQSDKISAPSTTSKVSKTFRPQNPRLAVRYYYAKFLAEARRRGKGTPDNMTATELAAYCSEVFPGEDPTRLTQLYQPARYGLTVPVTSEDAKRAAELWKALKRSRLPKI